MKKTPRRSKSFKGTRELTLQKYDMTSGSPQISTLFGQFTFSDIQQLLKDGYEIMPDWDKCRQLTPKNKNSAEQSVRKVIRSGSAASRKQNAIM